MHWCTCRLFSVLLYCKVLRELSVNYCALYKSKVIIFIMNHIAATSTPVISCLAKKFAKQNSRLNSFIEVDSCPAFIVVPDSTRSYVYFDFFQLHSWAKFALPFALWILAYGKIFSRFMVSKSSFFYQERKIPFLKIVWGHKENKIMNN